MAGKLTDRRIQSLKPGSYGDAVGLRLEVDEKLNRKWIFRYTSKTLGKRRDHGLGTWPSISLKEAREAALDARRLNSKGVDPIDAARANKRSDRSIPTFGQIAERIIEEEQSKSRNEKVQYQWRQHLGAAYCGPILEMPVTDIKTIHIAEILRPIWHTKPEVSRKLLPKIRKCFDRARVVLRDQYAIEIGINPAEWRDLKALGFATPRKLSRGSHPSLPYSSAPSLMNELKGLGHLSAMGLRLLILTAVRTDSIISARWHEFDLKQEIWTIPLEHLKDGKHRREPFRVPLPPDAIEILKALKTNRESEFVLPGQKEGTPCSNGIFLGLLKRLNSEKLKWIDPKQNRPITAHGFRATFRTWAEEKTDYPREVVEEAMGHQTGTAVERVYRQTDILEKRLKLMCDWANYLKGVV